MKRATIFKMLLMLGITAAAVMLPSPARAAGQLINLNCTTQCNGASGVTHSCTAVILGITFSSNIGINQPVQACSPIGSIAFDPAKQQVCVITPDAPVGIAIPLKDQCGLYKVDSNPGFTETKYQIKPRCGPTWCP